MPKVEQKIPAFCLTQKSSSLDPRIYAFKDGLADIALAGRLFSSHYVKPITRFCGAAACLMRKHPSEDSPSVSQILPGEAFAVLEISDNWVWGYSLVDHYVGYLPLQALSPHAPLPDKAFYSVTAMQGIVFSKADIKSQPRHFWSLGSRFQGEEEGNFIKSPFGYIHKRHCCLFNNLGKTNSDPVSFAEKMIGLPYLWGGRGAGGIDCSGLVQLSLQMTGHKAPRDSDMQRSQLGYEIAPNASLLRGDYIFFAGHVGIMADEKTLLHANAFSMSVTLEALSDVVTRLSKTNPSPILARRRL
ncbi:MAG: NlpC/P60 family protein [Zymomonas mobilis]|uniref:C40 family peptidase n=1 Tax=Zymomonas mobilis TaxID=542 RepID=UPI0039ECF9FD